MVTAGIFPFRENCHGRARNRTRDLMISSQRLWPPDNKAGQSRSIILKELVFLTRFFDYSFVVTLPGWNHRPTVFSTVCFGSVVLFHICRKVKFVEGGVLVEFVDFVNGVVYRAQANRSETFSAFFRHRRSDACWIGENLSLFWKCLSATNVSEEIFCILCLLVIVTYCTECDLWQLTCHWNSLFRLYRVIQKGRSIFWVILSVIVKK